MALVPDVEQKAMLERLSRLRTDQWKPAADEESDDDVMDMRSLMEKKFSGAVFDPTKTFHHCSQGMQYVKLRGRRKSREFEDLLMHTSTGKLNFSTSSKRNLYRTNSMHKDRSDLADNSTRQPEKPTTDTSRRQSPLPSTAAPRGQTTKGGNHAPIVHHTVTSLKRMNSNEIKKKALHHADSQPLTSDRRVRKSSRDNSTSSLPPHTRTRLRSDDK